MICAQSSHQTQTSTQGQCWKSIWFSRVGFESYFSGKVATPASDRQGLFWDVRSMHWRGPQTSGSSRNMTLPHSMFIASDEWPVFLRQCGKVLFASAETFVLRARAARKSNSQNGLFLLFRYAKREWQVLETETFHLIGFGLTDGGAFRTCADMAIADAANVCICRVGRLAVQHISPNRSLKWADLGASRPDLSLRPILTIQARTKRAFTTSVPFSTCFTLHLL